MCGGTLAERVGFEPTNTVRCYTLSRRAPSTARPPLLAAQGYRSGLRRSNLAAGGLVRGGGLVARRDIVATVVRARRRRCIGDGGNGQRARGVRRIQTGGYFQRRSGQRVLIFLRRVAVGNQFAE